MARPMKNQWDFGELFTKEQTRQVLTVSELTQTVKRLVERQVGTVWVSGEITNLRAQSSGHIYFTLKDAASQLACVLFRGEAGARRDLLQDGQKVLLQGEITVYEARGQYQMLVRAVELQGVGALQLAFEKLKQKLSAEGLFAQERKRPLPPFTRRIGLVTSPTGAAIRDVLTIIRRRQPNLEIIFVPCRVQGQGAAEEIAAAVKLLNRWAVKAPKTTYLDLILVTRGGGSLEDLWAFNEEVVARAVFESAIPVVSAVGHEIDFSISDFVADFRAPTPSAAAEIITEGVFSSRGFVEQAPAMMREAVRGRLEEAQEALEQTWRRLVRVHPRSRLNESLQRLDDLQVSLERCAGRGLRQNQTRWFNATQRLLRIRPSDQLKGRRESLARNQTRLLERLRHIIQQKRLRLAKALTHLRLVSPEHTLARGYSITQDPATGKVIRHADEVEVGQRLETRVYRGTITSQVEKKS